MESNSAPELSKSSQNEIRQHRSANELPSKVKDAEVVPTTRATVTCKLWACPVAAGEWHSIDVAEFQLAERQATASRLEGVASTAPKERPRIETTVMELAAALSLEINDTAGAT